MIKEFDYFAPQSLKEALELLDKLGDDAKLICGGQSLLVLMRQGLVAPANVIDIKGLTELDYIKKDDNNGIRIGAVTTHRTIEKSKLIQSAFPVLAKMEKRLASIQTRNRGSIGGNLCHGDPAGDPAPVLMLLDATLKLSSLKGDRTVRMDEFNQDYFETVLEHNEMLTEIQLPPTPPHTGIVYHKFSVIQSDMATVAVGVSITLASKNGCCRDCRITLGNCAPTAMRARKAEEVLKGKDITAELFIQAGEAAAAEAQPVSDINASAEYRRELVKVLVKRYAAEALAMAKGE